MKAPFYHIYHLLLTTILILGHISASAQSETTDSLQAVEMNDTIKAENADEKIAEENGWTQIELNKKDSLSLLTISTEIEKQARDWTKWRPDPKRAMWLAIVIPGAGQIYNRKYWKLPIVYGGFVGCAYAMRWNNQMFMDYSQAYVDIMDDDPNTKSYEQFLHLGTSITPDNIERFKKVFKSRKDRYHRWRDLSFFCMLGVYALSIIDAYVDASLSQFDISDDLSLHIEPGFVNSNGHKNNVNNNLGIGVNCSLNF